MFETRKRPIVSADFLGGVSESSLDKFIESYLDEHLETAMFKVLARRGGLSLEYEFQDKLDAIWYEQNPGELANGYDRVRYSEDTPEYVRIVNRGYSKSTRRFKWIPTEELT